MSTSSIQPKKLWTVGPLTVLASIVGVLIVRTVAVAILTPPFAPGLKLIFLPIVLTFILCTAAVLVFALIARFAKSPVRTFIVVSTVFLLISFLPDLAVPSMGAAMPGANWSYAITLMIMHVVAGFITVTMLIKLTAAENK